MRTVETINQDKSSPCATTSTLVTPRGGTVLDPFLGSGSTAKAAILEGFEWVGIEREAEYVAIAEARLDGLTAEPEQLEMLA